MVPLAIAVLSTPTKMVDKQIMLGLIRQDNDGDDITLSTEETELSSQDSSSLFSYCEEDVSEGCRENEDIATDVFSFRKEGAFSPAAPRSILLQHPIPPIAINERGPWKRLPKPDINLIEQQSTATFSVLDDKASKSKRNRQVMFDKVTVRHYCQTIGDNPSVSYGPPIQLDWEYQEQPPVLINAFEGNKKFRRTRPRQFCMNYYQRCNILSYYCGVTEAEIKQAVHNVDKTKRERTVTRLFAPAMIVEDFFRSAGRKAQRLIAARFR